MNTITNSDFDLTEDVLLLGGEGSEWNKAKVPRPWKLPLSQPGTVQQGKEKFMYFSKFFVGSRQSVKWLTVNLNGISSNLIRSVC